MKKPVWLTYGWVLFSLGIASAFAFNTALEATNTTEFCTSCHSMKTNLREFQETVHYNNASGVRLSCADCHVPKQFGPKILAKIRAAKDVWFEITGRIDTPEKYEAHRWAMANVVWERMRATDSRECRNCHSFTAMDTDEQGRLAVKKHKKAQAEGKTCIDCHQGIAHELPDEPEEEES